jgi:hypothetical protein
MANRTPQHAPGGAHQRPLAGLVSVESVVLRFVLATLLIFSPLFFANLLFSLTLRDQEVPEHVFGWNLVGATAGGVLEYTSMLVGYANLTGIVLAAYATVLLLLLVARRRRARTAARALPAGSAAE